MAHFGADTCKGQVEIGEEGDGGMLCIKGRQNLNLWIGEFYQKRNVGFQDREGETFGWGRAGQC